MYPNPELASGPKSITVVSQPKEVFALAQFNEKWFNRKTISVLKGWEWLAQVWYLVRTGQEQDPNLAPGQEPHLRRTLQRGALGSELFCGWKCWRRRKMAGEAAKFGRWKLRHPHGWQLFSTKPGIGRVAQEKGIGGQIGAEPPHSSELWNRVSARSTSHPSPQQGPR